MNRIVLLVAVLAFSVSLAHAQAEAPAVAHASQPSSDAQLMRVLIEEIRALREAIQQNAALDLRSRVLVDRARMQSEIVRELQREVEQRAMNRASMMEEEPFEPMMTQLTEQLRTETDQDKRGQIEIELDMMKKRREMYSRHQEMMREQERQMETRLVLEQRKLDEIQRDIMALEAQLTRLP